MGYALTAEEAAALYRRYVGMVYQICLMLLKNVPDAEDAAQTVFRKAMERKEPFRDPEHERAWLIVTAKNECRDQLKHWWRTRRAGEESLRALSCPPPEGDDGPVLPAPGGRRPAGADLGPAGEVPAGPLSPLLPGLYRPGDRGPVGAQSVHCAHLAGPGP